MKKLILCLAITLSFLSVNAQTTSGSMMIGGGITYYSDSYESSSDYENNSLSFTPSFGYFLKDNLALGLSLELSSSTTDLGITRTERNSVGFGPFVRYYKFTTAENFAFFGQANFFVSSGKIDTTPGGETKSSEFSFALSPGFSYFFNDHWALDLSILGLSYESSDPNKNADNDKQSRIIFSIESLSPSIGIRYHFGG